MKKSVLRSAAALAAAIILAFTLSGCAQLAEDILRALESALPVTESETPYTGDEGTEATPEVSEGIPYEYTPDVTVEPLPSEDFTDDIEREASEIIDGAIASALACTKVMKDGRHSDISYPFDGEASGAFSELTDEEVKLLNNITAAASRYETFSIDAADFNGDLKKSYFNVSTALLAGADPFVSSYTEIMPVSVFPMGATETKYTRLYSYFFDPYKDPNEKLSDGDVSKLSHDMALLDRIIKRVVGFMPEGLSTYDQYYYLAAVLSEHVMYDDRRPDCFSAFGALVEGRAVCEGYSLAYYLLCKEANLWCALRCGLPEGTGHQWNMIKLDSGIYNVDVTWCDVNTPVTRKWYDNFVKNDEYFNDNGHAITSGVSSTGTREPSPYEDS